MKFRYLSPEQESDYGDDIPFNINCSFESRLRRPSAGEIGYPYRFIDKFLEDRNIYIPDITWLSNQMSVGEDYRFFAEENSSPDFEEFYYVSFL